MLLDYHTHTPLCNHAVGEPVEHCRRAIEIGLPEIGFSDHSPMPPRFDQWRMGLGQLPEYLKSVLRAKSEFPDLTVRVGLEADFHPGTEDYVQIVLAQYEFDYVIGSIHHLGDWGFDSPDEKDRWEKSDVGEVWAEYFGLVERLAQSGLYDILGHADVVKKFGYRPSGDVELLERKALEAVAKAGMAIELNTSGLRFPCKEMYPSERMIRAAREMEIPVTLGSDAHRPEQVGADFDQAVALLREVGYTNIARYEKRESESVPLG